MTNCINTILRGRCQFSYYVEQQFIAGRRYIKRLKLKMHAQDWIRITKYTQHTVDDAV